MEKFLVINIGGSSTKVAYFEKGEAQHLEIFRYDASDLKKYGNLFGQLDKRLEDIKAFISKYSIDVLNLNGIIVRGPIIKPVDKGTYLVNKAMIKDLKSKKYGEHPTNLGALIGKELSENGQVPVYTVDLPSSDELISEARYTGLPFIKRKSLYQALNHHAVGRKYANTIGKQYEEINLVVAHLGTGTSVASHKNGKVIDVTNGLEGDGPMGLDRTGTLPIKEVLKMIHSKEYSINEMLDYQNGQGGVKSYLNTINAIQIEKMINKGDTKAKEVYQAMAFQIAKAIGAASTAIGKKPDAIVITGGLANSDYFMSLIRNRVSWITDVIIMPEENEMDALVLGVTKSLAEGNILDYK